MITGQNTEVLHADLSFHVQTEDKGRSTPIIESLVYLGGQVLASTRTDYADLLAQGIGAEDIAALMNRQHKTMIAAILRGRLDSKVASLSGGDEPDVGADDSEVAIPVEAEELSLDEMILGYLIDRQEGAPRSSRASISANSASVARSTATSHHPEPARPERCKTLS